MNIIRENFDELNGVIKIQVEKNDYEEKVNKVLKDYQRKSKMPGFRPGKASFGVISRLFRTSVLVDELNKLVSENLSKYISENKIDILVEPLSSKSQETLDLENSENFEMIFDIALKPDFELNLSKNDKVPFYHIIITDDMIENEIKIRLAAFTLKEKAEKTGENSLVKGEFKQLDESGNDLEDGIINENSMFLINNIKDEDVKNQLIDKKIEDSVILDIRKAFPCEIELSYLLNIKKTEAENLHGNFRFTIREIEENKEPELNQELFDKMFGIGMVNSIEEMKEKIKKFLEKKFTIDANYCYKKDVRKIIKSNHEIKLPEEFIIRWLKNTNEKNENFKEEDIPQYFESLMWQLLFQKIINTYSLELTEEDLVKYTEKQVEMQYLNYNIVSIPNEHIKRYAADLLKNKENVNKLANEATLDLVFEYLKKLVTLENKKISKEDFDKLYYLD